MAPKRKRSTARRSTAKRTTARKATSTISKATDTFSKTADAQQKFARRTAERATRTTMDNPFMQAAQNFQPFANMFSRASDNTEKMTKAFGGGMQGMPSMANWGAAFQPASAKSAATGAARKGTTAVKDIMSTGAKEAQKAQEKMFSMSRESVQHVTRSADAAARSMNDAMAMSQDNIEAVVECGNIAAGISKTMSEEMFNFANDIFSQNVELSQEIFACRTLNDMFELQSKIFKSNIDGVFNETAKISEMMFQMASKAAEPISERMADATDRMTRTLAAA